MLPTLTDLLSPGTAPALLAISVVSPYTFSSVRPITRGVRIGSMVAHRVIGILRRGSGRKRMTRLLVSPVRGELHALVSASSSVSIAPTDTGIRKTYTLRCAGRFGGFLATRSRGIPERESI
jgi:hypothetical protein